MRNIPCTYYVLHGDDNDDVVRRSRCAFMMISVAMYSSSDNVSSSSFTTALGPRVGRWAPPSGLIPFHTGWWSQEGSPCSRWEAVAAHVF